MGRTINKPRKEMGLKTKDRPIDGGSCINDFKRPNTSSKFKVDGISSSTMCWVLIFGIVIYILIFSI